MSFTIVDVSSPDAAETLKQMLYAGGYALPKDELASTQTLTKNGSVSALGRVSIELLGGGGADSQPNTRTAGFGAGAGRVANSSANGFNDEGTVLEKWTLHNAWIKKIEFSELDYEGDDLTEVTVELRYDYAELNDTKVGAVYGTLNVDPDREPSNLNGQYEVPFGQVPERQD